MDASMPGMDGFKATTLISQSQPDVKIFFLRWLAMRNLMHAEGATAYINKDALSDDFK